MNQIYPDAGLVQLNLRSLAATVRYRLFTNNATIDRSTVLAGLTEAAWTGYINVPLTDVDFTLNGVVSHVGYSIALPVNFANSSGSTQTAYGYYVTDTTNTYLLAVAKFDSPRTILDGTSLQVTPSWGDFSLYTTSP